MRLLPLEIFQVISALRNADEMLVRSFNFLRDLVHVFFPWAIINLICSVRRMVPAGFRLMAAVHQLDGVVS